MSFSWKFKNMLYPCNKILYSYKRSKPMIHATAWMDLYNSLLSGRSQVQKCACSIISFISNPSDREKINGFQELEVGWDATTKRHKGDFPGRKMFYIWFVVVVVTVECTFIETH